jgi:hypothetical protein
MKGYFYLLFVLYLATVMRNGLALAYPSHPLVSLRDVAAIVLFGLCVLGCHSMAFARTRFNPPAWRLVYTATLALGVFSLLLHTFGERMGVTWQGGKPHFLSMVMDFLNYLLFAVPVILLENRMKKEQG